jgi:phosphoenolpyruvate carboxylase
MKEEDWINEVMRNLDRLPKAETSHTFMQSLENTLREVKSYQPKVKPMVAWLAAASVALLLTANITLVNRTSQSSQNNSYDELLENYGFSDDSNPFSINYDE